MESPLLERTASFDERKLRAMAKVKQKQQEAAATPQVIKFQAVSRGFLARQRKLRENRAARILQVNARFVVVGHNADLYTVG